MEILENLRADFNRHIQFREKRPGIVQVLAPLYHEDGDMVDIFLDLPKPGDNGPIRISDHGLTLMRLSYSYEVDTSTKKRVFDRMLSENGVEEDRGRLTMVADRSNLYPAILQFAQTIAKVTNLQAFKREVVRSMFYETLGEFVQVALARYRPQSHYLPLPDRDDLEVDWTFLVQPRSIYLYGVKDNAKARLAALACREFQIRKVSFRSVIVHEDFQNDLSKKDQARIINAADKQFTSLAEFTDKAEQYFEREVFSA